jgi:hypothetical protein
MRHTAGLLGGHGSSGVIPLEARTGGDGDAPC